MAEPKRVSSLEDLRAKTRDYTIVDSSSGDELVIQLRDLMPEQLADINRRIRRPSPPLDKAFPAKNNPITGAREANYDYNDPEYKAESTRAEYDYLREWLLESITIPIPGETHEEKLAALKEAIPFWVLLELRKRMEEANGLTLSDVALEKKASRRVRGASQRTEPAKDAAGQ